MNLKEEIRAVYSICVTLSHQCHADDRGAVMFIYLHWHGGINRQG